MASKEAEVLPTSPSPPHNAPTASSSFSSTTNITGYRFVNLPDCNDLRQTFRDLCEQLGLKGLILLATEGLNYFLAGDADSCAAFRTHLDSGRLGPRFVDIPCKVSQSAAPPFKRMLVKVKKEIISMGVESCRPAERTGPHLAPRELQRWLDEGKEVLLLDTRNDYEVRMGAFKGCVDLQIDSFREFPEKCRKLAMARPEALNMPVVTYCTGGVRCEKATVAMMDAGFRDVYQLDGGILRYFEECGARGSATAEESVKTRDGQEQATEDFRADGKTSRNDAVAGAKMEGVIPGSVDSAEKREGDEPAVVAVDCKEGDDCGSLSGAERYWEGDCFVFDNRVAVNCRLEETDAKMCFNCREPLKKEDQASPLYVVGKSCPFCNDRKKKRFHAESKHGQGGGADERQAGAPLKQQQQQELVDGGEEPQSKHKQPRQLGISC